VTSRNTNRLFARIFNNVYPQINGIKRGILYKTIQIIVGEEQSLLPTETSKICDCFGIKPNANKLDDKIIIDDLLDEILINIPILKIPAKLAINNFQGENMEWIFVAAAFTFVGLFFYKQTHDPNKPQPIPESVRPQPIPQPPIPADLCLVIPASIANDFINRSNLKVDELIYLIDNASYFLCTTVKVADSNEQNLEMTNENISPDSIREVYIRININDGRKMIDQTVRYSLKTDIPIQAQCIIKKLACLKNLSGLQKFNRI
jgi:hypothetical protein